MATETNTKTYRGRTLEEVLPKIKADLGADAEIVRQRSGLTGGVGGFFQRACVEVEARPPEEGSEGSRVAGRGPETADHRPQGRRFSAYDDSPAVPEPYGPEPEPSDELADAASFVADPLPATAEAEGLSAP